jgi:hypothetical protein
MLLLFLVSCARSFTLVLVFLLWLRRRQLGSVSRHLHSEALLVFRTNGFPIRFCGDLLGGQVLFVCVLHLNGEKGGIFFDLHWNPDWFCHGIRFRRSLSTNLFLCVWEGGGRWMEKSDLFDWLY